MLMPVEESSSSLNPSILESEKKSCDVFIEIKSPEHYFHMALFTIIFFLSQFYYKIWVFLCAVETIVGRLCFSVQLLLCSLPADVLRGSSHVPAILNSSRINDILHSGYDLQFIYSHICLRVGFLFCEVFLTSSNIDDRTTVGERPASCAKI